MGPFGRKLCKASARDADGNLYVCGGDGTKVGLHGQAVAVPVHRDFSRHVTWHIDPRTGLAQVDED